LSIGIHAMNLKDILGEIKSDNRNVAHCRLLY
jgi:hypothetical protein